MGSVFIPFRAAKKKDNQDREQPRMKLKKLRFMPKSFELALPTASSLKIQWTQRTTVQMLFGIRSSLGCGMVLLVQGYAFKDSYSAVTSLQ